VLISRDHAHEGTPTNAPQEIVAKCERMFYAEHSCLDPRGGGAVMKRVDVV
jgi:hypothetical protein